MNIQSLKNKNIVCLGGGIGTVNLIRGLKVYSENISVIASMADDGGSAGRLRRLYNILPPGDIISCMAALTNDENIFLSRLLTYRFPGERYGKDEELSGQKLGSLMLVAARDLTGSFEKAYKLLKKTFDVKGDIFPATKEPVTLIAKTIDGKTVETEEKIDLGDYQGKRILERVCLKPEKPKASPEAMHALRHADVIVAGPGDLYTTILPVLIVPEIKEELLKTKAPKLFVVNVANKPFETRGYSVDDFISAITKHLDTFPFNKVIVNSNFSAKMPSRYNYGYVKIDNTDRRNATEDTYTLIKADLVDEKFPLYHDHKKLASEVCKHI